MDLLAARSLMAVSLGFHILFAVAGMAMPLLMVLAEWRARRSGGAVYDELARRWAKGTAILFAVGAVSGTALSFELGLSWPSFMAYAGPIIGMPFSLEGFAFFIEAIFLGIYLYGWDRVGPRVHWVSGVVVALSGLTSGVFVMSVNAWMNTPAGFTMGPSGPADIDLRRAFFSPAFFPEALHMALAAYAAVGFAVMGIHAWALLRDRESPFHRAAFGLAFGLAAVATPLQLFSGDLAARHVAEHQPVKLAALEGHFHTEAEAPLSIFGLPDVEAGETRYAIHIPALLSLLAYGDPEAEVRGLLDFPRALWPPVAVVHVAFQLMVGCGMAMLAFLLAGAVVWRRSGGLCGSSRFLRASVVTAPLGLLAIEAGWVVTEVGRQPWIIQGVMKTHDAVTPVHGLIVPFVLFTALYLLLGVVVVVSLRAHVFRSPGLAPHEEAPR